MDLGKVHVGEREGASLHRVVDVGDEASKQNVKDWFKFRQMAGPRKGSCR